MGTSKLKDSTRWNVTRTPFSPTIVICRSIILVTEVDFGVELARGFSWKLFSLITSHGTNLVMAWSSGVPGSPKRFFSPSNVYWHILHGCKTADDTNSTGITLPYRAVNNESRKNPKQQKKKEMKKFNTIYTSAITNFCTFHYYYFKV